MCPRRCQQQRTPARSLPVRSLSPPAPRSLRSCPARRLLSREDEPAKTSEGRGPSAPPPAPSQQSDIAPKPPPLRATLPFPGPSSSPQLRRPRSRGEHLRLVGQPFCRAPAWQEARSCWRDTPRSVPPAPTRSRVGIICTLRGSPAGQGRCRNGYTQTCPASPRVTGRYHHRHSPSSLSRYNTPLPPVLVLVQVLV